MDIPRRLYDLLFEVSSEERHKILLILKDQKSNLTTLADETGLNLPETRRHVTRLVKVDLIERVPDGSYILTHFGNQILETIEEISFFTENKDYFLSHSVSGIPREYQSKLRDLSGGEYHDNILQFIRRMESVVKEATEYVCMLVDQFPLNHLSSIMESIENGIMFRIIEPKYRVLNPDFDALALSDSISLDRIKMTPSVEQRMIEQVPVLLVASERDAVIAFPTLGEDYDYKGFHAKDQVSRSWCMDLFKYYWDNSFTRTDSIRVTEPSTVEPYQQSQDNESVTVIGKGRPSHDIQALQNAVDRYDKIILQGQFNLGTSTININRSVTLCGEGRTNNVPETKIYKYGWDFPFIQQTFLLHIYGDDIDVTIENLHFENFNGTCIGSRNGNSLTIRRNRITLNSGLGRGLSFGNWGDHVVGITAGGDSISGGFLGGILIEENYLDFALSYARGGFITKDGKERDPAYRPNLQNHEASICVGMNICRNSGNVSVRNNTIKNMNSRGILVFDNWETADIQIHDNIITSEVFGAYPYNNPVSGVGIFVQSAWSEPRKGAKVSVYDNRITLNKLNYCGVAVHGPAIYKEGAGKLEECIVKNNQITLKDGLYGIQVRKSDNVSITGNIFLGSAYYGLQISGSKPREGLNLLCSGILINDNKFEGLSIMPRDSYSDQHVGDYVFYNSTKGAGTAQVWLNRFTENNSIHLPDVFYVIDEGENNKITLS